LHFVIFTISTLKRHFLISYEKNSHFSDKNTFAPSSLHLQFHNSPDHLQKGVFLSYLVIKNPCTFHRKFLHNGPTNSETTKIIVKSEPRASQQVQNRICQTIGSRIMIKKKNGPHYELCRPELIEVLTGIYCATRNVKNLHACSQ
jgi:hypothetical protein